MDEPAGRDYADIAEFYDHVPAYRDRSDVAFFVDEARAHGPVLELGSGTGRVSIPIARVGVPIVGLDASGAMLACCRRKLAAEPDEVQRRVELMHGDMAAFDLGGRRFGLVTFPFRSFQHLVDVEAQVACLTRVARHLLDGGRVVIDVFNPSFASLSATAYPIELGEEPAVALPDGRVLRRAARVLHDDLCRQTRDVELEYLVEQPGGRLHRHVQRSRLRYFFRYELEHLLARCGFRVEALYGDYGRRPFEGDHPPEMIVVASRL